MIGFMKKKDKNYYNKICESFKSYGSFINFTISEKISINSKHRREILNTFFKKKTKNIK